MSFSPPSTIALDSSSDWGSIGYYYAHSSNGTYQLNTNGTLQGNKNIQFTNTNGTLNLNVNPSSSGSGAPSSFKINDVQAGGSGVVQQGQTIKLYNAASTLKASFTMPNFYSGNDTNTEGVLVEDAKMVYYEGITGWRFEQRGYAAGSYQLIGGTINESWTVSTGSNNLQHHISQIPAGGTYILYSGTNELATLTISSASKKVFCNFW